MNLGATMEGGFRIKFSAVKWLLCEDLHTHRDRQSGLNISRLLLEASDGPLHAFE